MTWPYRAGLAVLLLVTALTYRGALRNNFVWDDTHTVVNNRAIDSLREAPRWFTQPETTSTLRETNYRPVLVASFAVDVALWGRRPGGFHAVNIALHLGVVLLTYALALRAWGRPAGALAAAALAALHPINGEAVNYISARSSLLSAAFVLAAVLAWDTSAGQRRSVSKIAASLGLGVLALGVKESAVVLPALILVWDRLTDPAEASWTDSLRRSWPWWALVAAYLAWRHVVLSESAPADLVGDGALQALAFTAKLFLASLGAWLLPIGWAIDHGWSWHIGFGEGAALAVGAIAAAAATVALWRWDPKLGWCTAWFWVSLAPLAALPWVSRLTLYQDHRVYLAQIGLALAGGEIIRRAATTLPVPQYRLIAVGAPAALLAALAIHTTAKRIPVWRDADTLWAYTLAQYPTSALARNHAALRRLEAGKLAVAREQFEASIALAPNFPVTHNYLGVVYARQGELDRAIAEFTTAIKLSPSFVSARMNLGNAYEKSGRPDLALAAYEQGIPDQPWAVDLIERAARLFERAGRQDDAQARYRRILTIDPTHASARSALAESSPEVE
ncbi:MAG: tetratricopeptide repeat protein [Nitrospirota bacterium]